jgi:branched-chain amino acid transport system permease protein
MVSRLLSSPLFWIVLVAVSTAAFLPLWVSGYVLGLLTLAYYFGVFSMAWDLLFGFANEVNFGPTFLVGLGAYTAGIVDNRYSLPIWACVALGTLAAVVGGVVLALPALRVSGPYFSLTTVVAVLILQNLIVVFADLTGGEIGLTIPDVISIDAATNYWIALGFMVVSGAILYALSRSAVGLILQASGQDKIQAGALGFNVVKHKLAAFIISAFFSGLGGALLAFYLGTASVSTLIDISVGVQIIIAAVLGGRRTIIGAAIGSIFLIGMTEVLRPTGERATLTVSTVALLVVLFLPNGFMGVISGQRGQTSAPSHWKGEVPLGDSFWYNGILLGLGLAYVLNEFLTVLAVMQNRAIVLSSVAVLAVFSAAIGVWQIVGIWRSANRYGEQGGDVMWAAAAKVVCLCAVVFVAMISVRATNWLLPLWLEVVGGNA